MRVALVSADTSSLLFCINKSSFITKALCIRVKLNINFLATAQILYLNYLKKDMQKYDWWAQVGVVLLSFVDTRQSIMVLDSTL